ncbi:MAG: PAS domain S-box protein, partial [Verrucomicrobiales bacterium]|nr:PAS domain S-box protein [Verrucomicrobiales bacterium]
EELRASTLRLRESEERFGKAFRSTPAILSIARLADERIIEVNEAFLVSSGYSRDEVLGRTTAELDLWVDADERDRFLRSVRDNGVVRGFEARVQTKQRRREVVLMSAERIELNGEPCLLALCLVVTDRKRAERELLRSLARERELSELKSRFVSMVSHEFRTPLGIILSSAEILENYLDRLSDRHRQEHLRDISQCSRQMAGLMEEVLVLGQVEAGKLEFKPAAIDLAALARRIAAEVDSATNQRCPIRVDVAEAVPEARSDAGLLRHILGNLIANAVKYSPPGAEVDVVLRRRNGHAVFVVRDRGIGIPDADVRRIYQAFHRGRNVGDTPGSGLGLMIVRRCVELHQGRIDFETREGSGTTFTVSLPVFESRSP